jgi:hydrogenase/urease accessory protein HupE
LQSKKEIQSDSNYINLGRGLGAILGSLGGYVFGSEVYANTANHNYSLNPINATGALVGAGIGAGLGNYLTFKTLAKSRGVDDRFSLRHFRKPA